MKAKPYFQVAITLKQLRDMANHFADFEGNELVSLCLFSEGRIVYERGIVDHMTETPCIEAYLGNYGGEYFFVAESDPMMGFDVGDIEYEDSDSGKSMPGYDGGVCHSRENPE